MGVKKAPVYSLQIRPVFTVVRIGGATVGDGEDNTTEENSTIFFLIRMR